MILKMFQDTVYAYEFALADMELQELTGMANIPSGLADGVIETDIDSTHIPTLLERLAYFEEVNGQYTYQKFLTEVQGAVAGNHAKAYMTHWMYPFKAKFHPQMIRAIFNIIGVKKGDIVLDPMTGSGTVNVEARLMGIDSIGFDCLPIAVLASQVKTKSLDPEVSKEILAVEPPIPNPPDKGLSSFLDTTQIQITEQEYSANVDNFFKLLYFECLSISRLPNRRFDDVWKKMLGFYIHTIEQSSKTIEKLGLRLGKANVDLGDARALKLGDESVNHIVMSPPYAIAIDYVVRNTEQLQKMGYSTKEIYSKTIGLRGKGVDRIDNYYEDLQKSIKEMHRVLKKNGSCVIVIGDTRYDKQTLPTITRCINFAEKVGLKLVRNIPKVSAGRFGLFRTERILIFKKYVA